MAVALQPRHDAFADRPEAFAGRRIGIVAGALATGSRERVIFGLAERLTAEGAHVDFLIPSPSAALKDQLPEASRLVDIGSLLTRPFPSLVRLVLSPPSIAGYIKRAKPDLIMTLSIPPGLATLTAKRLAGRDTAIVLRQSNVVRIQGSPRYDHVDGRWRDRLIKSLYPGADAFIAVSEGVADNLARLGGIEKARIHAIPNGIFADDINAKAEEMIDHPWLGDDQVPVVVAVGRLVKKKEYPTLFRAFADLRKRRPARLIVLGEGRIRPALESLIAELGLKDSIDLPGRVGNPFAYLSRASLYVLSSTYEGMPSALIEALACGCPAVSTDCPSGPSEILANGDFGRLVPVGEVQGLADAMAATLADPPSRERQRARSRDFLAEKTIDGYLDVLADVLRGRQAAAGMGEKPSASR